ncbi:MAG: PQQ-binding-like beta-propeller repeat protein, partial [Roseiflexaceae bacterium]
MRYVSSRIISLATIVLIAGALVAFVVPYRTPSWQTALDRVLPIDQTHTLTFTADGIVEQWQIAPLSSMASVLFIPNDINVATPALPNQRLFMITRRIKESTSLSDVREFYARNDTGDFLLGQVRDGRIIAYAPRILVRPQHATNHTWNQFFTDGAGGITASQIIDSDGCRQISIRGRDITAWHETLCSDTLRAQNHDANDTQTALRQHTPTVPGRDASKALPPPTLAQLDEYSLTRIGNMQIHDNNEKVIAPLVVLQPQNVLLGTVTSGFLAAMRITDGSYAWEYNVSGDIYGAPSVDPYNGDIILATTHKEVHRVSVDGVRRWSTTLTDPIVADPCATPIGVVVADTAGNVSLLAAQDGHPLWSYYVGANVVATPVFVPTQQTIVIASQSGSLTALSLEGSVIWQSENEEAVLADLKYDADTLYVVGNEGSVSAYDVARGDSLWVNAINARTQWPITLSVHGLAVATPKSVHLLNHDGTPRALINEQVTAPP